MPHKNAPRIVKLYGGQQDQYFIIVEQDILVGTSSISSAVLLWFAAHYAFDMEYGYTDVGNFFQDFIFCVGPHKTRKSSYKTITGSIKLLKGMQCFIHVH